MNNPLLEFDCKHPRKLKEKHIKLLTKALLAGTAKLPCGYLVAVPAFYYILLTCEIRIGENR